MKERFFRFIHLLFKRRSVPLLERISTFARRLSPGDRLIVNILCVLVISTSIAGLITLERSILVKAPAYGGTLVEGVIGAPRFVNPLLAFSDTDRDLTALTYAGLMGLDGDGKIVPVLAESYSVSTDGRDYTFVIRADAVFQDGTPVTADDVAFTVQKAQDPTLKSPQYANWANIRVEVEDARTVSFILPKAYSPFVEDLTLGILPAHLWKNVKSEEFPFSPLMQNPVGAGPFKVDQVIREKDGTVKEFRLVAFKKFAPGRAFLDGIRFKFFDNSSTLRDALARGTIQSAYGVSRKGVLRAPYTRVFAVFFNPEEKPVLARLEVRKALSLVIDREKIVNDMLGGYASPLNGPVPPGSGIDEPALPAPGTRLEDARAVLTDAGWEFDEEAGVWKNAKQSLTLDSITLRTSDVPELKTIASLVREEWIELGVPTTLELYEPGDLTQNVIRPRKYDALLFGMVVGRERDLFAFWDSSERTDPGLNIAGYTNRTVDGLLSALRESTDPATVQDSLQQASDLISADYPAAFTHAPEFLYAVPQGLEGVRLPQITSPSDRFASVASWHTRSEYIWPFLAR
ncbi:MAG: family 5 extracellular solute-binding protein peptide/nickel transport system substrate-binding [Parcubacteria group bacterium]|nr:family 5 extracellular solute-binding protein peptide/nickel transport system substrate-binding [Parcubacteria group bacterium]